MAGSTKEDLIKKLEEKEQALCQLQMKYDLLASAKKTEWEQTDLYKDMVKEANHQVEYYRQRAERAESDLAGMRHKAEVINKDNAAQKKDYRIGDSSEHEKDNLLKLQDENIRLAAMVEAKEETIRFLRSILPGGTTEPVRIPRRGPKAKIPEEQKIRVIEMHKNGASTRMIAQAEGISVGSVSGIVRKYSGTENR